MKNLRTKMILFLTAATITAASAAAVLQVKQTGSVAGNAAEIWAKVGDFCAIADWHPVVTKCEESKEGETTFRTLTLKDGGIIKEKLTGRSDESYTYQIIESPLPVKDYNAVFAVRPDYDNETKAKIVWSASFQANGKPDSEAKEVISGVFLEGVKALEKKLTEK